MTLNCKVGDLAIIITSDYPSDIGMVVEVLGEAKSEWVDFDLPEWRCKSDRISVVWDEEAGHDKLALDFDIPDAWLRPITGLPVDEEITDEVTA